MMPSWMLRGLLRLEKQMGLDKYTTEALLEELKFREEKAKLDKQNRQAWRSEKIAKVMTQEVIDVLAPEHDRTSCSDSSINNGFVGGGNPRCTRCALLVAKHAAWPYDFKLRLFVERDL
jgi:hypothetical protein